jgi:hypothetical protein
MRTTITLADDVSAGIEQLRRERSLGLSEAVNELIRRGLAARPERRRFRQVSHPVGLRIDVTDVADALEVAEASEDR